MKANISLNDGTHRSIEGSAHGIDEYLEELLDAGQLKSHRIVEDDELTANVQTRQARILPLPLPVFNSEPVTHVEPQLGLVTPDDDEDEEDERPRAHYFGAAGGPVGNVQPLPLPVINFENHRGTDVPA